MPTVINHRQVVEIAFKISRQRPTPDRSLPVWERRLAKAGENTDSPQALGKQSKDCATPEAAREYRGVAPLTATPRNLAFSTSRKNWRKRKRRKLMFGHLRAEPILRVGGCSVEQAVEILVTATNDAQPVRWIEFPAQFFCS